MASLIKANIEERREGNKFIAEFMGVGIQKRGSLFYTTIYRRNEQIQYHSSWDWLMRVVEKIEQHGYKTEIRHTFKEIGTHACHIYGTSKACDFTLEDESKIKAVWLAVVEFIEWYNQHNVINDAQ